MTKFPLRDPTKACGTTHCPATVAPRSVLNTCNRPFRSLQLTNFRRRTLFSQASPPSAASNTIRACRASISITISPLLVRCSLNSTSRECIDLPHIRRSIRYRHLLPPRCPLRAQRYQTRFSPPKSLVCLLDKRMLTCTRVCGRKGSRKLGFSGGYNVPLDANPFNSWAKVIDCGDIPVTS